MYLGFDMPWRPGAVFTLATDPHGTPYTAEIGQNAKNSR
jgi:hypothetical protein